MKLIFTATVVSASREDIAKFLEETAITLRKKKEGNCLSVNNTIGGEWDLGPLTVEYLAPRWAS